MDIARIVQQGRRVEPRCAVATSPEALAFKAEFLKKTSRSKQELCLALYARADLPNLVRLALSVGLSPDTLWEGRPVLSVAAAFGAANSLKALLEAGADVALVDAQGGIALHSAVVGGSVAVISLLLNAGSNIEAKISDDGCSPLGLAASRDKVGAIGKLLARGANANSADNLGKTPLMRAILSQHLLAVRALLPVSDLSLVNNQGLNAFHLSVVVGNEEIVRLLLLRVTDVDVRTLGDSSGDTLFSNETALHVACSTGRHAAVRPLLRRGAQRTVVDDTGSTPLLYASTGGWLSICTALLGQPGAFRMTPAELDMPTTSSRGGLTALQCAAVRGHTHVCGVLLQAGASLDAMSSSGATALTIARHNQQPTNASLLALLSGTWVGPLPGTACERCSTMPDSALMHCSGCLSVRYCCPRCATTDWPRHAEYCRRRKMVRETGVHL